MSITQHTLIHCTTHRHTQVCVDTTYTPIPIFARKSDVFMFPVSIFLLFFLHNTSDILQAPPIDLWCHGCVCVTVDLGVFVCVGMVRRCVSVYDVLYMYLGVSLCVCVCVCEQKKQEGTALRNVLK